MEDNREAVDWLVGPFETWRVVIDGRVIPRLAGCYDGDKIMLVVDGRFGASFPRGEIAENAAALIAQALAVGEGYASMSAEGRGRPFAARCREVTDIRRATEGC